MEKPTNKICLVSRKENFPFEKVLWACFLKKAAMQWSAKNLQLWFWLCFWKFQFNQNEKDFQPSFWFYLQSEVQISCLVIFLKVAIQWKWRGLSTISFWLHVEVCISMFLFWKSQFNQDEKNFTTSFWLWFHRKN